MATYYNKELIDGVSELPRMTKAEFDELSLDEKPINWICRNYTGTQRGIKSSDIEHGTGTVADALNAVPDVKKVTKTLTSSSNGDLDFSDLGANIVILQVKVIDSASQRLQAGVFLGTYASYWFGILRRYTDLSVLANMQVNVEIYYV